MKTKKFTSWLVLYAILFTLLWSMFGPLPMWSNLISAAGGAIYLLGNEEVNFLLKMVPANFLTQT